MNWATCHICKFIMTILLVLFIKKNYLFLVMHMFMRTHIYLRVTNSNISYEVRRAKNMLTFL